MDQNRRTFLTQSFSIMALLFSTKTPANDEVRFLLKNSPKPLDINAKPSFSKFLMLSKVLTATNDLDSEFAQRVYNVFMQEPWVAKHVNTIIAVIQKQLITDQAFDIHKAVSGGFFAKNETWFIGHLVFTWFSGLYYYTGKDKRLAFEPTLAHKILRDIYPTPTFIEGLAPSFWSAAPEGPLP